MPYDHATKIGNQGDVVKHIALFAAMRQLLHSWPSNREFVYADIHAGRARYVLPESGEWRRGIRLLSENPQIVQCRLDRDQERRSWGILSDFDERFIGRTICPGSVYPGSSGIAFNVLNAAKVPYHMILCENNCDTAKEIKSHFKQYQNQVQVVNENGYDVVKRTTASLVLIDPPALEASSVIDAIRFLNTTKTPFLCWTPRTSRSVRPTTESEDWSAAESAPSLSYISEAAQHGVCLRVRWYKWGHRTPGCCITISPCLAEKVSEAVQSIAKLMKWEYECELAGD